jgi:hypothetical protein
MRNPFTDPDPNDWIGWGCALLVLLAVACIVAGFATA